MSNIIRSIIRESATLTERFAPQLKAQAKRTAGFKAYKEGMHKHPDGLIYPQQGTEFDCSPTKPEKEYQKNQPPKKRYSWPVQIVKKAGKFYRKYSNGKIHEILRSGQQVNAPDGFRLKQ